MNTFCNLSIWDSLRLEKKDNPPFVPIHNWSSSNLNVSRTLPPDLLYIPEIGCDGKGYFLPWKPGITSSGLPYFSNTFLWICKNNSIV